MSNNEKDVRKTSKFLSLVLRHRPEAIDIQLDDAGWTPIDDLIEAMRKKGKKISREQLDHVVATNDKQRFIMSDDGTMIRASQGHSVAVELGYDPAEPPEYLLHGTPSTSVAAIQRSGLQKMKRHHVHLHLDELTASAVGARRGVPVMLRVRAREMAADGLLFYVTTNEVWLTDHVPPKYIEFPDTD